MLNYKFLCPICREECANPETLREHRKNTHDGLYKSNCTNAKATFTQQWFSKLKIGENKN